MSRGGGLPSEYLHPDGNVGVQGITDRRRLGGSSSRQAGQAAGGVGGPGCEIEAVVFGAGNVGRGFVGQLFSASGYRVTFVDVDAPLVDALASRGAYTVRIVDNQGATEVQVGPVTALHGADRDPVAEALARASLAATAVGARALRHIAPALAEGIARRRQSGVAGPLNIIVCENLKGAPEHLRALVAENLGEEDAAYMQAHVGYVETVIGRMVPELPAELRDQDPSAITVEPYAELPVDREAFVGAVPRVVGMQAVDHFERYAARKLYLHNAGHAVLGYLGYQRGLTFGYEALEDPVVRPILEGALDEALRGIVARYGAEEGWLRAHVDDLLRRFANRALGDPLVRLARDPLRKLAPDDRLVGAARVAEEAGLVPLNLAWGIAGALAFDAPEDPLAADLQRAIAEQGAGPVLQQVCGIEPGEILGVAVLARYRALREGSAWT